MPANLARLEQATSLAQSAEAFGVYMSYEQLEARQGQQAREAVLGKQEQRDRDRRERERGVGRRQKEVVGDGGWSMPLGHFGYAMK